MHPVLSPMAGADHHSVAGLEVDVAKVGGGRMKRLVYPVGYRWSTHMKPVEGVYEDGCSYELEAPAFAAIAAGHDAWVVGEEPAVFIQFDFEEGTARRFGLPERHEH
jgi:hypothetical protein